MLSGLLLFVAMTALIAFLVAKSAREPDFVLRNWQAAMQRLGLTFQAAGEERRLWRGKLDGVFVQAELGVSLQRGYIPMTLSAGANLAIPRSLEVYADSLMRSLGRLMEGNDVELGDAEFDQLALLPNLDAHACAALSHGVRSQLSTLLRRGGQVREGRVSLDAFWGQHDADAGLEQSLRWLARLARLLSVPREALHQRLAQNALHDPAPAVRLQNLRFLAAPDTRAAPALLSSAARALLADVHAPVRLLAARLLGPEGLAVLAGLLGSSHPPELVCNVLSQLQREHASVVLEPVQRCCQSSHESVRLAAAQLLGNWALAEAEPALLALLADPSPHVQYVAAQALGGFGSVNAVEHLLPLARALLDSQLRQAARAAVGSIQSRLGPVEAGRISLAEPQPLEGAVALADHSALRIGELSLSEAAPADEVSGSEQRSLR